MTVATWRVYTCRKGNCEKSIAACKGWLIPGVPRIIGLVTREMGLMVQRGNPFGSVSLAQLLNPAVRFVNRDPDSGTRLLFEQLLAQEGLDGSSINGYEHRRIHARRGCGLRCQRYG